jgi:hypothetical protein
MKKLLLLLLLIAVRSNAQNSTTVTATVTDAGGVAWANGTYEFDFVGSTTVSWAGGTVPRTISGNLDNTGSLSKAVPNNNTISPQPNSWNLKVCPNAQVTAPPSSCFTKSNIFVTGATQTVSITPLALVIAPGVGQVAYATNEVSPAPLGSQVLIYGGQLQICTSATGNTCLTWSAAGGGSWASITGKPGACPSGQFYIDIAAGTCAPAVQPVLTQLQTYGCSPIANPVPNPPWVPNSSGLIIGTSFQAVSESGFAECEVQLQNQGVVAEATGGGWSLPSDQYASANLDHFATAGTQIVGGENTWQIGVRVQAPGVNGGGGEFWGVSALDDNSGYVSQYLVTGPGDNTVTVVNPRYLPVAGDAYELAAVGSTIYAYFNGLLVATVIDGTWSGGSTGFFVDCFATGGSIHDCQWSQIAAGAAGASTSSVDFPVFAAGVGVNAQMLLRVQMTRQIMFPAGAALSKATASVAATGSTTFTLKKNGTPFATVVFAVSGTTGTWTQAADAQFAAGDILEIDGPATHDTTLANIGITLAGCKGTVTTCTP